jgi:hypothetical protein
MATEVAFRLSAVALRGVRFNRHGEIGNLPRKRWFSSSIRLAAIVFHLVGRGAAIGFSPIPQDVHRQIGRFLLERGVPVNRATFDN